MFDVVSNMNVNDIKKEKKSYSEIVDNLSSEDILKILRKHIIFLDAYDYEKDVMRLLPFMSVETGSDDYFIIKEWMGKTMDWDMIAKDRQIHLFNIYENNI